MRLLIFDGDGVGVMVFSNGTKESPNVDLRLLLEIGLVGVMLLILIIVLLLEVLNIRAVLPVAGVPGALPETLRLKAVGVVLDLFLFLAAGATLFGRNLLYFQLVAGFFLRRRGLRLLLLLSLELLLKVHQVAKIALDVVHAG